jgi:DNA-repair protein XRCC3
VPPPATRRLLNGGIPGGSITELVGESTVGKTQLCLQLLLTAQLPEAAGGLAGRSLYITTEGSAPLGRLKEIAAAFPQLSAPCDNVLIANASANPEQLLDAVRQVRLPLMSQMRGRAAPSAERGCCIAQASALAGDAALSPPVRLVIIDSITNPFRELDATNAEDGAARSRLLYQIACTLKEAAHRHASRVPSASMHA